MHNSPWFRISLLACLFASLPARGEDPPTPTSEAKAEERYEFREDHDPNGIGKFYMGREIAHVMGFAAAIWLERPEREDEEAPSKLIKALDVQPGQVVADIGAGSGVLTFPLARKVGKDGKVLAVDVQQEMLDRLQVRLKRAKLTNVEPVLGTEKSPQLPAESVDLAIMVDVYHEFEFPYEMMQEIAASLKPGGRVVFVEYRKEDRRVPIKEVHKMSEQQVKQEISLPEFGLKWSKTIGTLPRQHIIIFEKAAAE